MAPDFLCLFVGTSLVGFRTTRKQNHLKIYKNEITKQAGVRNVCFDYVKDNFVALGRKILKIKPKPEWEVAARLLLVWF